MARTGRSEPKRSHGFPWIFIAAGTIALFILLALGTWQVQRLQWKEGLIATIEDRIAAEPQPLSEIEQVFAETGEVDYLPVRMQGTFRHDGERHVLSTWQGASGWNVYAPLELADGRFVFVNRGFVPFDRKDRATREEGLVSGAVTVTGLARDAPPEKPSFIVPDNEPEKNSFFWKDLKAMIASSGLPAQAEVLPFFIDADDISVPGGLPVGGVTIVDLPNNHLQYAVTWYGLAAALVAVMGFWLWRRGRPG